MVIEMKITAKTKSKQLEADYKYEFSVKVDTQNQKNWVQPMVNWADFLESQRIIQSGVLMDYVTEIFTPYIDSGCIYENFKELREIIVAPTTIKFYVRKVGK